MLGLSFAYTSTRLANRTPSTAGPYTRCQRHSVLLMTMPDMHDTSRIPSARVSINPRYPFLGVLCKMRSAEPLLLHHNAFADCTKPQACCVENSCSSASGFGRTRMVMLASGLWHLVHGNIAAISAHAMMMAPGALLSLHRVLLDEMLNCLRMASRARCVHCILCLSPSFSPPAYPGPVVLSMFHNVLQLLATSQI